MTTMTRIRRRGVWMAAIVVLLLALALAACGGRAARGNGAGSANSNPSTQQTTTGGAPSDVVSADNDLQQMVAALDSAQTDASVDASSSDTEVQP